MLRRNLFFACALAIGGCAAETQHGGGPSADCNPELPGDVDCNPGGNGGKGDAWDAVNDPRRLSQSLEYRAAELPLEGRAMQRTWAASYWPTMRGSTNYRWQGESTLSPLEKYDQAFNGWTPAEGEYLTSVPKDCGENAPEEYGAYREWLGPAARWQSGSQGRDVMFDGRDNDGDGKVDECDYDDHDGIESWWGLCHAWAPAAILEPEPLHAVEYNGQRFEVSDIKALLITVYDGTESLFLGGRCNAREFERDEHYRITMDECRDVNAGAWHVVVANFLGLNGRAFVEDRTAGFQVWNQPLIGYRVTMAEERSLEEALAVLGIDGGDAYPFNEEAVRFYEVKMTTDYLTEGHQSTEPLGEEGYIRHDNYHYILELDQDGKIIGGEWAGSSRDSHPDFLWVPLRPRTGWGSRSNPHVDLAKVRELLRLSRQDGRGTGPVEGETYTNEERVEIPDDDPNGARSVVSVPADLEVESLGVTVEIEHTYVGDLEVALEHDGRRVVLRNREGGSADDLVETFTVSDFAGASSRGDWVLHVVDHAAQDVGAIEKVAITFVGGS